jgi:hypothetical protein
MDAIIFVLINRSRASQTGSRRFVAYPRVSCHSPKWGNRDGMVIAIGEVFCHSGGHQCKLACVGSGMKRISSVDQRKISAFVRELYCLGSVQAILDRVVQNLSTLIAANSVFIPTFDPRTKIMSVLANNIGPGLHKLWPTLVALRHNNPALTYHLSHATAPAFTMGDLLPRSRWKKTAVFNESIQSWICKKGLV